MLHGSHRWNLLEKKFSNKKELQAIERRQNLQRRAELMKVWTVKVPVTVPSKTVHFAPTMSISMVVKMPVTSIVLVHGNDSDKTSPTN